MLRKLTLCVGVCFAVVANAALSSHVMLVGQHMNGPSLICEYSGPRAKYEILAQHGVCARYIDVQ